MGVRETLAARRVRESKHAVWTSDPTGPSAELQEARAAMLLAGLGKAADDPVAAPARERVEAAEAALDACREWLVFHGLRSDEFEALVQAHPAPPGGDTDDVYDAATFIPALLEACAQDSDLTAADWADELAGRNPAEKQELIDDVMAANARTWSTAVPKG